MIRNTWVRIHALRSCVRRVFGRKSPTFFGGRTFLKIFTGSSVTLCLMPVVSAMEIPNVDDYAMSKLLQNSSVASAEAASAFLSFCPNVGAKMLQSLFKITDNKDICMIPNVDDYAMSKLLQNSSVASAEAASAFLSYVTMALYNTEKEYTKGIYTLIKLIEMRLENPGHPDQDKMEELIVETRIQVKSLKKKRQDLMMLLSVCQRLVNDASEAAYMAGAEFAGYTTNNKLTSSESFLSPCEMERVIAERHLSELEAHVIEVESKRAKEEEESETKQEEVKDDGNSGEVNEGLNSDSNTKDKKEDVKSEESTAKEKGDQSIDEGMEETDIAQKDTSISSETSPEADNKEFIPRMDYVETFNIGSQDESMEDD